MKLRMSTGVVLLSGIVMAMPVTAGDGWEMLTDNDGTTMNHLAHGEIQSHDLHSVMLPNDLDWARIESRAGRSYEIRMLNSVMPWDGLTWGALDRVDQNGNVLTPGAYQSFRVALRWMSLTDQVDFVRVFGGPFQNNPQWTYDIQLLDTTYQVPRFNNSATQVTAFLIQNATSFTVTGSVLFYAAAGGAPLHSEPLSVPVGGLRVFATSSIPALAGVGGSATIVHDGGYGALAGKAVALEPATGFSFDTAFTPIPY
jgi:hypothetical protein